MVTAVKTLTRLQALFTLCVLCTFWTVGCSEGGGAGAALPGSSTPGGGGGGNTAPVITSNAPTTATVGQTYNYLVTATDVDGDTLSTSLNAFPSGMTITGAGLITWVPTAAQVGLHSVSISVSDSAAATPQNWSITVSSASGGGLPSGLAFTDLGALPNGMLVLSDMAAFDGRLIIAAANNPLGAPFGAGIYAYTPTGGITTVMYDSTTQGFLRAKVYDNKLYIPDGDPNGLTPGIVYVMSPGVAQPQATSVTNCVHNFDVVKLNGQLYVTGSNGSGQSSLNRFNPATNTWDAVSAGAYGRLKYAGMLDGKVWSTKQVQSGVDGVWVDSAMAQSGWLITQSGGSLLPCIEEVDGSLYMSIFTSTSVSCIKVSAGSVVTALTGDIAGKAVWDVIKHSDGYYYAVGLDSTGSKVWGSTDGVNFTVVASSTLNIAGQPAQQNADGRASIASFNGKLYVGSSTNGHLYRLD